VAINLVQNVQVSVYVQVKSGLETAAYDCCTQRKFKLS
jgi:hypothetical protein